MTVCCQNLTLGSRSVLSVRVGALFKKSCLFWTHRVFIGSVYSLQIFPQMFLQFENTYEDGSDL